MNVVRSSDKMQACSRAASKAGKKIGFVPTMGFLHDGHLSLVRRARKENDVVVVSIFVNPTQFGPKEDFGAYPRDLKRDLALLKKEKVDVVFVPSASDMYPDGVKATVKAGAVSMPLEGTFRPGHFDGVCTVVKKLFDVVRPQRAYFGQKDFQQTAVVQDMVARLKLPVKIVVCPTVREPDGLAMSSRNVYLSPDERKIVLMLQQTLLLAKKELLARETVASVEQTALAVLTLAGFRVQYFKVADAKTLAEVGDGKLVGLAGKKKLNEKRPKRKVVISVAAYLGKTRLIDNVVFRI